MNILQLLQAYQGAQGNPSMAGPVMPQNPQPGFRAPPGMQMNAPQGQAPGFGIGDGMGMIGAGLAGLNHSFAPGMEPNRTAGDRDLNGYGGSPVNPFGNPNAVPTVYNPGGATSTAPFAGIGSWLRGLF